jgi:hypothetical protein
VIALGRLVRPLLFSVFLAGCGGGAPLLHPAHVLPPGHASIGGGVSGQLALRPLAAPPTSGPNQLSELNDLAVAPGVAPWAAGRFGFAGDNEAGLTYAGRTLRVDARHAFTIGKNAALSIGLGADAVLRRSGNTGDGADASGIYGGGADIPMLFGVRSASDLYALWVGPRVGFDIMSGRLQWGDPSMPTLFDVMAKHFYGGLTAGFRVGFRHVHLAVELDGAYHFANGSFQPAEQTTPKPASSTNVQQISLTPSGALIFTF